MNGPSLEELLTLEPPEGCPDDARITVTAADLRALLALVPDAHKAREHVCAKSDGTHMTDEQIAELFDAAADDSGDAAYHYWEELGDVGKQQELAFARALLKLNPYGDWEALANAVKALPHTTSGDPAHSTPLERFWSELGDVAFNDYRTVVSEAKLAAENLADIDAALRPLVPAGGSEITHDGEPTPGEVIERAVEMLGELRRLKGGAP